MTTIELSAADETKVEEFAGNLFMAALATLELANVELGVRLGLYEALAGAGPVTAAELASSAGIAERYARGGWSSRPSPAWSKSTTRPGRPTSAGSRCRTPTPTSSPTTTARRA